MEPPVNGITFTMSDGLHMIAMYPFCEDVGGPGIGIIYPLGQEMMAKVDLLHPETIIAMMQVMLLMLSNQPLPGPDPGPRMVKGENVVPFRRK